jgi:hypothetical protein
MSSFFKEGESFLHGADAFILLAEIFIGRLKAA